MRLVHLPIVLALALAPVAFGAAGCGGGGEETAAPAEMPAPAPEPAPTPEPAPAPEPAATAGGTDVAAGAALYATYCASCHGPKGDGDGPVSAGLNPKPAKHSDAAYMDTLSDEHLFKVIKEGGPAVGKSPLMAPWGGTLSDAQIHDVVAFVRTLSK
jgi:mono/diheme cytochrome c family protein